MFNDEVEMLSTFTTVGSIGVLANHQPLLTMLDPTELRLYRSESDVLRYAQGEGFLQMSGTHALVLVDEVFALDELDAGTIGDRLREAEERLERAEEGSEERRQAERAAPTRTASTGRPPATSVASLSAVLSRRRGHRQRDPASVSARPRKEFGH